MSAVPALVRMDLDDYPIPREFEPPKESSREIPGYLSLFDQDSEYELSDSGSDLEEITHTPFMHLRDVIDAPMSSLSSILEVLLPRLQPRPEVKGVSMEDQRSFMCILIGELANQFRILHQQIDDPFLSSEMNLELHRQMSISVCMKLEQMYAGYIYKAAVLKEGIFSLEDSLSYMRAELVVEANKRLNIPHIRREVLDDMRGSIVTDPVVQRYCGNVRKPPVPKQEVILSKHHPPKYPENLDSSSNQDSQFFKFDSVAMTHSKIHKMKKIKKSLPPAKGFRSLLSNKWDDEDKEGEMVEEEEEEEGLEEISENVSDRKLHLPFIELRRVASLPDLWGDFIICDLKYTTRDKRPQNIEVKEKLLKIHRPRSLQCLRLDDGDSSTLHNNIQMGEHTVGDLLADLHQLVARSASSKFTQIEPEDSNPLLQAHVPGLSMNRVARLAEYEANLKRRKEEERREVDAMMSTKMSDSIERIPSVPTLEQLPYLKINHVSVGSLSTNLASTSMSGSDVRKHHRSTYSDTSVRSSHTRDGTSTRSKLMQTPSRKRNDDSDVDISGLSRLSNFSSGRNSHHSHSIFSLCSQSLSPTGITPTRTISRVERKDLLEEFGDLRSMFSPLATSGNFSTTSVSDLVWEKSPDILIKESSSHTQMDPVADSLRLAQPQQDVVSAEIYGKGVVRTAQVRVSERIPLTQLRLKSYGPIYNELAQYWETAMTDELDSNLYEGKDVSAIYKEIMEMLPGEHLLLGSEPTLEPSLEDPVDLKKIFASGSLHHRPIHRVINKELQSDIFFCPWDKSSSRKKWEESSPPGHIQMAQPSSGPSHSTGVSHHHSTGTTFSYKKTTPSTATAPSSLKPMPSTATAPSSLKPMPSTATAPSSLKPMPSTATAPSSLKPMPSTATAPSSLKHMPSTATALSSLKPMPSTATVPSSLKPMPSTATAPSSLKPTPSTATALSSLKPMPSTATALSSLKPTLSTATALSSLKPMPSTATALSSLKPMPSTATALSSLKHMPSTATAFSSLKSMPSTATALSSLKHMPSTVTALSSLKPMPSTATVLTSWKSMPSIATALSSDKPTLSNATVFTLNTDDYFKFVSRGETDYLQLSYHLYDSQSDSEEEEEVRMEKERIAQLTKLRAKERRIQCYKENYSFTSGNWNVSTAITDRFSEDSGADSSNDEADGSLRKESLRKWSVKKMEIVEKNLRQIWEHLHMSRFQQIDMAIKYCCNISTTELNMVLCLWKQVCNMIDQREEVLRQLEVFEKTASDPSRFFDKGVRGSAAARLEEARRRDKLHTKLNKLDKILMPNLKKLYMKYGDSVTYKGRLYTEKMRLDRTEMLYYLQQARRQAVLKSAEETLALKGKVAPNGC